MKRFIYALIAVAATLSFAACNQEEDIAGGSNGKNTLALTVGAATRSEAGMPLIRKGAKLSMGDPIEGQALCLEETITSLDDPTFFSTPETRGTPVYTENFATISGGSFKGLAFQDGTLQNVNAAAATYPKGKWADFTKNGEVWEHSYEWDPWYDQDALLFYAKMLTEDPDPSHAGQPIGVIATSYRFLNDDTAGQRLTFSYRSPLSAEEQQDILFAARKITKQEAKKAVPILFYHALTGVKFATGHSNDTSAKTYIKSVAISGIYGYGKCTVTTTAEGGDYVDIASNYSSASAVSWDKSFNGVNDADAVYYQEFPETPVTYTGGSFGTAGNYPSSFSAAGNKNNLNDADASLTFWFVPQTLTDATQIEIVFEIEVGGKRKEYTRVVKGTDLNNIDWKAGELRTYTLKATEVDVKIEDEVHGFVKDNVVITNTGNVEAFIRAHISANWWGKADGVDGIAMGYKSNDDDTAPLEPIDYVDSWQMVGTTGDNYGGVFTGLPGSAKWVHAKDGYFYYVDPVAPGEPTGSPLFTKYELVTTDHPVPVIWYLSTNNGLVKFDKVHLVMDIPVQAIQAKKNAQGEFVGYKDAWAEAGVTVVTE